MSDEELTKIVEETVNEVGDLTLKDMAVIMKIVMGKIKGRADENRISSVVREKLS